MGNNNSKWSDFTKQQQIMAVKNYTKSIQTACDEFIARLEAGDVEEVSEPEYVMSRAFTSGTDYEKPEFSFKVTLLVNGLAKKEVKENEFWPRREEEMDSLLNEEKDQENAENAENVENVENAENVEIVETSTVE